MPPAVQIEHISKQYRIGALEQAGYRTLRESLVHAATGPWRRFRELSHHRRAAVEHVASAAQNGHAGNGASQNGHAPAVGLANANVSSNGGASAKSSANGNHQPMNVGRAHGETFWALDDVSFNVEHGEVVGIIGRNGAGKSTLLKILSRITEPTHGRVVLNGRVASLLEVGTGFHPELTGRENIYLNGAILGMHRHEIKRKFDAIVDFSGIEQFLDTPVKRYSSGMYVRLAFAVAAHLDPEILIVDEVLAVGDAEFQKKCLGKMQDVAESGRTVLFVSHNLAAVANICSRGVLLSKGTISSDSDVQNVLDQYQRSIVSGSSNAVNDLSNLARGEQFVKIFQTLTLRGSSGQPTDIISLGDAIVFEMALQSKDRINSPVVGIGIDDAFGQRVLTLHSPASQNAIKVIERDCRIRCSVERLPLVPGTYSLRLALSNLHGQLDNVDGAAQFTVVDGQAFGEGRAFHRGTCIAPSDWSIVATRDLTQ